MGAIFSKPKMPDTSAIQQAQLKAMEKQSELLDKQEARIDAQEEQALKQASARARSRRMARGGFRMLLSPLRGGEAAQGITGSDTKLGG
jgi:hypothetical protein